MISSNIRERIKKYTERVLNDNGLELVEFKVFPRGNSVVIRVVADYPQGGVTIDQCAKCNKMLYAIIQDKNLTGGNFEVEVNSPGLNRKLKTRDDFIRAKGRTLCLWFHEPFHGKNYCEGVLEDIGNTYIQFEGKHKIPFTLIRCAKQRIDYE